MRKYNALWEHLQEDGGNTIDVVSLSADDIAEKITKLIHSAV